MPGIENAFWIVLLLCQLAALYALFAPGAEPGRGRTVCGLAGFIVTVVISLVALRHSWVDILVLLLALSTAILWLPAARRQMSHEQKLESLRRTPGMIGVLCLFDVAFVPHGASANQQYVAFAVMVLAAFLVLYVLISGQIRKIKAAKKR